MFNFIKRWFPLKAGSLEDFANLIKREQCSVVEGKGFRVPVGFGARTATMGRLGNFQYSVELTAIVSNRRRIVYKEVCEKRFGSDYAFADAPDRNSAAIKCLITAEDRLKKLVKLLSPYEVKTYVKGPPGRLNEKLLKRLHQDAEKLGIEPA